MLEGLTKDSTNAEVRDLRRIELRKAVKLINYYHIQITRNGMAPLYKRYKNGVNTFYKELEDIIEEVLPQPSQSDINKELQQKVDNLEKQVVDLNQKLRQRAII